MGGICIYWKNYFFRQPNKKFQVENQKNWNFPLKWLKILISTEISVWNFDFQAACTLFFPYTGIGHLLSTPRWVKVHAWWLKNSQNSLQFSGKNFRQKHFRPKISKNLYYMVIFGQKFNKSREPAKLNKLRDACNSAKWLQYTL